MNDSFKIEAVDNLDQLVMYQKDWDRLLSIEPYSTPTQSFAWTYAYLKHKISDSDKWICLFAFDTTNNLIAVYPLFYGKRFGVKGFGVQIFRVLNDIYHTVRVDGLIKTGSEHVYKLLLNWLEKLTGRYVFIKLQRIPDFSPTLRSIRHPGSKYTFFAS